MELRHLKNFLVVAETLNISEAARRLRVTQPALSRHIRSLEHAVGHPLFLREPAQLRLTAAGKTLQAQGAKALAAVADALERVRGAGAETDAVLRVGYYGIMWSVLVAPALRRLKREFPNLTTRLNERSPVQLAAELRDGRLDVAVLAPGDTVRTRGIIAQRALSLPALVALPADHPLAKKRVLRLTELRRETFLSFARHVAPGRDHALIAACRLAGFSPKLSYEASSMPELLMAVATRGGIAMVAPFAMRAPHPGAVFARLEPPGVMLETSVGYRPDGPPAGQRLAALIVAEGARVVIDS